MILDWCWSCKAQGAESTIQRRWCLCSRWKQKVCFEVSKGTLLQSVMTKLY